MQLDQFLNEVLQNKLIITAVTVAIIVIFQLIAVKVIKHKDRQAKRLRINMVNNLVTLLIIISIANIWSDEIQKFAISIAAFIVAIVLATREFIQCFIGFVYILTSRPFRIGDWIQVGNYCGEVHSSDWAKLSLLEVNIDEYQYTGKTLYLPNNQLFSTPIKNLNFLKRYATHHFDVVRDDSVNPYLFLPELQQKAIDYCQDFSDVASRYNQLIENRLDITISGPEPHITVSTNELGHTVISITIFCPTERAIEIEQQLISDCLAMWFAHKPDKNTSD